LIEETIKKILNFKSIKKRFDRKTIDELKNKKKDQEEYEKFIKELITDLKQIKETR